jgi:beta-galactosidase
VSGPVIRIALVLAIGPSAAAALAAQEDASAGAAPDWEDPAVFERGQVAPHATLMPFADMTAALEGDRKASPWALSLGGRWAFHWAAVPEEAPAEFFRPGFDASSWDPIEVPSSWQMQGFGHPVFRNIPHPFPATPPTVPDHYNPVGSYLRTFELPDDWEGRRVLLHFEGVKSASYVWINGREIGYNQGGMEPAEYDVTAHVRPGENTLAVRVYRFSDGSYLEDQDMWRLSGIYRDVYLMATPPVHVRDFFVITDLDTDYRDAGLRISAEVSNALDRAADGYRVRATLYPDGGGAPVIEPFETGPLSIPAGGTASTELAATVAAPRLWSAERPDLYRLVLELIDGDGETVEVLGSAVGFREVEIRDQVLLVNGRPVKLNAVNSHMHHPATGRAMDVETMREDLVLMKRFNLNAVRTSHYPPNPEYLELADRLGVYVIDETGDEAHATEWLSERPEWRAAYVDRGRKLVLRDRNHPSVVIWSAGNESGSGDNICAIIAEGKRLDPTRPWLYGGNNDYFPSNDPLDCEDIVGPRYPIPFGLKTGIGAVPASVDPRPSFMDEYAAATGNGLGAMDEFWDVIRSCPRCAGGAVWDWVSPGIYWPWRTTPDASPRASHGAVMGRAGLVDGRAGGRALDLSGHDEWVELYRDPGLDVTGDQLTLALWVLPRRWTGHGPLITKGDHQFGLLRSAPDSLEFFIHDRERIAVSAATPEDWEGRWHHVAGVYDGAELRLYVDGAVSGTTAHSGAIDHNPFPVNVGRNAAIHGQEHPGELLNAVIDDVRIFARALDRSELDVHTPSLRSEALLWLDFESIEEEGEYFSLGIGGRSYGVIWPDRVPQPELWQLKKSAQAVGIEAVDIAAGRVRVINRHAFTDLAEFDASWRVTAEGMVLDEGPLEIALPPAETTTVVVPLPAYPPTPGLERFLELRFTLAGDTDWAPRGHEVAWEQLPLPAAPPPPLTIPGDAAPLELDVTEEHMVVRGAGFAYTFDRPSGTLSSMEIDGVELLRQGPRANVWRAPLANDRDPWGVYRGRLSTHREGMGLGIANGWRAVGLDRLVHTVERMDWSRPDDREVVVEVEARAAPGWLPPGTFSIGYDLTYIYRVLASGDILLEHTIIPVGNQPDRLPKVGLQMVLADELEHLEWSGRGPFETYPDRRTGARIGVFRGTVEEQYVPYLVPQDYGNKSDVRWVSLANADGVGLFAAGEELLEVSAQHFGTDNLSRAWYRPQLTPQDGVTLNLDHRASGVGGTAVSVLTEYRVFPQPYEYSIRLRPYRAGETPRSLARQAPWPARP